MTTPAAPPSTHPRAGLPSHLRGPFSCGKMQMTAKDWALLRDRDGNRIVKHRLGDVVAVMFGEDDAMEAERAVMLAASPAMFAALQGMVALWDGLPDGDTPARHLAPAALTTARSALASAGPAARAAGADDGEG